MGARLSCLFLGFFKIHHLQFVPAVRKLTLNDSFRAMSHHFEGTWFDNTGECISLCALN